MICSFSFKCKFLFYFLCTYGSWYKAIFHPYNSSLTAGTGGKIIQQCFGFKCSLKMSLMMCTLVLNVCGWQISHEAFLSRFPYLSWLTVPISVAVLWAGKAAGAVDAGVPDPELIASSQQSQFSKEKRKTKWRHLARHEQFKKETHHRSCNH